MRSTGGPLSMDMAMTPSASAPWCMRPRIESSGTTFCLASTISSAATASVTSTHREREIDFEHDAERDADQARLRHGLAEIGHAVPDDERSEGRRDDREPDRGRERAHEKRLHHCGAPRPWALGRGLAGEIVPVIVMVMVDAERTRRLGPEQAHILGMLRRPSPARPSSRHGG